MGVRVGIWIEDWEFGIGDGDWEFGPGIGIWDMGLRLIENWNGDLIGQLLI